MMFSFWFQNGHTPLMAAAEVGQVDCIRVLVMEMGCKKDAQNKVHNYYVSASSSCMYSMCKGGVHLCSP